MRFPQTAGPARSGARGVRASSLDRKRDARSGATPVGHNRARPRGDPRRETFFRACSAPTGADAAARSVAVRVEPVSDDLSVWADQESVWLVFSNLMENALRHTPAGGSITLRVSARCPTISASKWKTLDLGFLWRAGIGFSRSFGADRERHQQHWPRSFHRAQYGQRARGRDRCRERRWLWQHVLVHPAPSQAIPKWKPRTRSSGETFRTQGARAGGGLPLRVLFFRASARPSPSAGGDSGGEPGLAATAGGGACRAG